MSAANLDYTPGREWRSTEDTAVAASILRDGNPAWSNWKRGQDYYNEGELLWLDADTLIRKMTDNKKSLDDFERIFLGQGGNTGPLIVTYTFDEVVRDLNQVVPYDWATFLHDRVDNINPHADLAGIERGGYKLVYADKPNASETVMSANAPPGSSGWCQRLVLDWPPLSADGEIKDVRWNGPADQGKNRSETKIIAVNGQVFSGDLLQAAIRDAKGKSEPIRLIVQLDNFVSTVDIDYHDGERYPVLERVEGTPAYLDDITKPLASQPAQPKTTVDNH